MWTDLYISYFRNGCSTSEDLFWKLDALQSFIRDLHWPDPEFAEHLNQRLKMMACDMIDSCIKRTDASFQNHLKKGILLNPTDYIVPTEICAMINVVLDAKNQSFKLCAVDGVDVVSGPPVKISAELIKIERLSWNFYLCIFYFEKRMKDYSKSGVGLE